MTLHSLRSIGQSVDFTYSLVNNNLCSPALIKFNAISSLNPRGYLWDFGNGSRSNNPSPSMVYNIAGTYNIKLILVFDQTTAEITKSITIKPGITVNIQTPTNQICTPDSMMFNALVNGTSGLFLWNFGDGSPAINGNFSQPTHYFSNYGTYTVSVLATSPNGCKATDTKIITVNPPAVSGSFSISGGCVPVTNNFRTRVSLPAGTNVLDYSWNFGDGSTTIGTNNIVNHTYVQPGDYSPSVTIRTDAGCTTTYRFDSVHYGVPPQNLSAHASSTRFCASETVNFVARANMANQYDWSFGGGISQSTFDTSITYQFRTLGVRNVAVTPRYNGCPGTPAGILVRVDGAVSRFSFNNSCNEKNHFEFINSSLGNNITSSWSFGDQNSRIQQTDASYTFPTNGDFWVTLIVKDSASGCMDTSKLKIYTATPTLHNNATNICVNTSTNFEINSTYNNNNTSYLWNTIGHSNVITQDSTYRPMADSLGNFSLNRVVISNGRGYCNDTLHLDHPLIVRGPKAIFANLQEICQASSLQIINQSIAYPSGIADLTFHWKMGDNSPIQTTAFPLPYSYTEEGNYIITLMAKDVNGCTDSMQRTVTVRPMPLMWMLPRSTTICQGQTKSLVGYTSDPISWETSLPQSTFCNTCDTNVVTPLHTTSYKAIATNAYQCSSTDSINIRVMEPFTATITPPAASICEQDYVALSVSPSGKIVHWSASAGLQTQDHYHPIANPLYSSTYTVSLSDSLHCFSSEANIHINVNPKPTIELGPNKMLAWNTVYSLNPAFSSNVTQFLWTPADKLNCATCANPEITVTALEQIAVKVTSDSGCISTDQIALAVACDNAYLLMPGAFTPDGDGLNDFYFPLARGMKYIKKFYIYNRNNQLMFQRQEFYPNDRQYGWNGRFKGEPQPPGTYVYVVEAICEFGLSTIKSGSFVLIR